MKKLISILALLALLGTSACSTEAVEGPVAAPTVEAVTPSTATPEAQPAANMSPRGNIIKTLGEGVGVASYDGTVIAEFVVDAIRVDPTCTGPYILPPENGHFIALDVSVSTKPELAQASIPTFDLNPYTMKVVAPNGTTSNAALGSTAAFSCLTDAEQIPMTGIGPAENVKASVVIDSEVPSGTLIISSINGEGSWEYNF